MGQVGPTSGSLSGHLGAWGVVSDVGGFFAALGGRAEVYAFFDQQDVVQPHPVTTTTTQPPKKQCKWWQLSC